MPTKAENVLATVVEALGEVLGTMFFSDVATIECRHSSTGEWTAARVCFSGAPSGEMLLMLSPGVSVIFAASFLGVDEADVTMEEAGQVCCELSNMICGAILSRVHPDSLVALGSPEPAGVDFETYRGFHQCFAIPEGTLAINLSSDAW